MTTVFIVIEVS